MKRAFTLVAVAGAIALAIWHPAPQQPAVAVLGAPSRARPLIAHHSRRTETGSALVYVVGAVRRPGLYQVSVDGRIDDAVRAAGGLRPDADPAGVNLAARTNDGDEIAVPVLGQTPMREMKSRRSAGRRRRSSKTHAILDVNTASPQELSTVPGIGTTIAQRIVDVRQQDGAYTTFDELLDVAGMTQSRLDRAQSYLRL